MGFSSNAKSNELNRKLQQSIRRNRFQMPIRGVAFNPNPKLPPKNTNFSKLKFKILQVTLIVVLSYGLLCLAMLFLNKFYKQSVLFNDRKVQLKLHDLYLKTMYEKEIDLYNKKVRNGFGYLNEGNLEKSMTYFIEAKQIRDRGFKVNYGITLNLLLDCSINNRNCELSLDYLKLISESRCISDNALKKN